MPGVIKSKIYIPVEDVDVDLIKSHYEIDIFDDKACSRCKQKEDRPNNYCEACQAYSGLLKLWDLKRINSTEYITLPSGNLKRAEKITGIDFKTYLDKRCKTPFENRILWTGNLREGEMVNGVISANQVEISENWLRKDKRYGFIMTPPRTGKSVLSVNISCQLGLKTLFLAHQTELLENFYKSWERDTNLLELREKTGKKLVSIINKDSDFTEDLEVALVTYQKFIRDFEKIRKNLLGKFGLVIIDEAHQAGAKAYAKVLGSLDCMYRLGMSATPLRKDALNFALLNIIGPVTVKSEATGLVPRIEIFETGIKEKSTFNWTKTMQNLQGNESRNKLILKEIIKDLKEHKCILIPVDTKNHMEALVKSINEHYLEDIAIGYHSTVQNRKNILSEIDSGKYKVIVAIRSMIKQGIDLKLPSMIYIQSPMSAAPQPKGSPMFYQMGNRVATPYLGKREPIIKLFVDNLPESTGCFMSLWSKEIKPGLITPINGKPRYTLSKKALEHGNSIVKRVNAKFYQQTTPFNPDKQEAVNVENVNSSLLKGGWL